ncbi:MAG TPA: hypothetical protein PKI19_10880 [Elusimicrobiales bacterium]|nr:hypothetical protein [Elusimicrobiales bacterium]
MTAANSDKLGVLLDYFLGDDKALLSASAASALSGFNVVAALGAMQLLESGGILLSDRRGQRRFFRANAGSGYYRRCRAARNFRPRPDC